MYHQTEPFNHRLILCTPTTRKVVGVVQKEFKEAGEMHLKAGQKEKEP